MATPSIDPGTPPSGYVPPAGLGLTKGDVVVVARARCVFSTAYAISPSKRQQIKTYVLLMLMLVFGTAGNIFLDKGMKRIGALDLSNSQTIRAGAARILTSGGIWLGIALLLLYMLSYMMVLSWADYSFVMPFTALSYALVAITGYIWLGESVPGTRWLGIALIVAGVFLVSRTPTTTTNTANASDRQAAADVARAAAFANATNNASPAKGVAASNAGARAAAGGR